MPRNKKYSDEIEEYIHPFWLGLIMLFTSIVLIGLSCFIRRKCRSNLRYLWNRLCCRDELNDEEYLKPNKPALSINSHQWAPTYVPPPSSPPKLYKLVRSLQSISVDSNLLGDHPESTRESMSFSRTNESVPTSNFTRNPEVARKLFAGLRRNSQCPQSSSIDSFTTELGDQSRKSTRRNQLKFIRTSPFLQSVAYGYD